jgi:hypothetical protein
VSTCLDNLQPVGTEGHVIKRPTSRISVPRLRGISTPLSLGNSLAQGRTHGNKANKSPDVNHDEDQTCHDEEDLDVELEKTAARLPVEAPPCIKEADASGATDNPGYDLAIESAVKRHNGVLVLWENGRLDTDHGNDGGKAEEQGAGDADDDDGDEASDERGPLGPVVFADIFGVIETEELDGTLGYVQRDVGHRGIDSSGEGEGLPLAASWDALPEASGIGHGNDLVRPGGVQIGSQGTCDSADNDETERDKAGNGALEHIPDEGESHGPDGMVSESAEAGETSTLRDQVFDGTADRRGDRLLVNERHSRGSLEETLLLVFGGRLIGSRDGDSGRGSLDHAERGDDVLEHVFGLVVISLRFSLVAKGRGSTYSAQEEDHHDETTHDDSDAHCGHLDFGVLHGTLEHLHARGMLDAAADDVFEHPAAVSRLTVE